MIDPNVIYTFAVIFVISVLGALWSLHDLSAPRKLYPKRVRGVGKVLSGVIHLPKRG